MREKWRLFWRKLHYCWFYGAAEGRLLAVLHPLDRRTRIQELRGEFSNPMDAYLERLRESARQAITANNRAHAYARLIRQQLQDDPPDNPDRDARVKELQQLEEKLALSTLAVEDIKVQIRRAELTIEANPNEYPLTGRLDLDDLRERWRCLTLAEQMFPGDERVIRLKRYLSAIQSASDRLEAAHAAQKKASE